MALPGLRALIDGPFLTAWTIRLALLVLAGSLLLRLVEPLWPCPWRIRRNVWTVGCGLFLLQIAAGMHFYHAWSHAHAYTETALQTEALLGVRFGGGIYFNHLMALLWTGDVLWWWLAPTRYALRGPRWEQAMVGYFLFIAFNGLVVFKEGMLRWAGLLGLAILLLAWIALPLLGRLPRLADAEPADSFEKP